MAFVEGLVPKVKTGTLTTESFPRQWGGAEGQPAKSSTPRTQAAHVITGKGEPEDHSTLPEAPLSCRLLFLLLSLYFPFILFSVALYL